MGGRVSTRRRKNTGIGSLMFPWVTFMTGYLLASVFDIHQLSGWISKNFLASTSTSSVKTAQLQPVDLPKPKFEFYTLLTKEQSIPSVPKATHPTPSVEVKPAVQAVTAPTPASPAATTKSDAPPVDLTVTQKLPLHEPLAAAVVRQPRSMPASVPVSSGRYIIQVGSFRNSREAEKMKAILTMRGFSAIITSTTQQQVTWYRVLIGPFDSLMDAQRVHREFSQRERIMGMIRKLDA